MGMSPAEWRRTAPFRTVEPSPAESVRDLMLRLRLYRIAKLGACLLRELRAAHVKVDEQLWFANSGQVTRRPPQLF